MSLPLHSTTPMLTTRLVCAGCGAVALPEDLPPFRCPRAGSDDREHILVKALSGEGDFPREGDANPFLRYRALFHSYQVARAHGLSDEDYVALVRALDDAVARVEGHGFVETPLSWQPSLGEALGLRGVWVKDETGNVSGSHKARHLMGVLLHLEVAKRIGVTGNVNAPLAIASCGNAALAAAVVARAADRALEVFIPPSADPSVVARLGALGATLELCPRVDDTPGDPCYHRFRAAVEAGRVPFACQGPDNGLTIEGGATLGYELSSALAARGERLTRLFVQVGGGALASAVAQGMLEAEGLGVPVPLPRLHPVQTAGGYPLRRAWERVVARALEGLPPCPPDDPSRARYLAERFGSPEVQSALAHASQHRKAYMWPWETEPHSVAHGILDDETYDWLAIVRATLSSGGWPVVVDEPTLHRANELGRETTGIDVDPTGSSGLAGLVALTREGLVGEDERVAVIFSGIVRR